jgi:hypothetical protein
VFTRYLMRTYLIRTYLMRTYLMRTYLMRKTSFMVARAANAARASAEGSSHHLWTTAMSVGHVEFV